jgi:hypothetical protein
MSTPVHNGGDANGVTSSGSSPGTDEVSQSTTPELAGGEGQRKAARRPYVRPSNAEPSQAARAEGDRGSSEPASTPGEPAESPPVAPETVREETESPPTAPEARRRSQAAAAEPHPRPSMRLPQGLGGPNIAAPSALELLRARNAIPPGVDGINLPAVTRPQFEGDVAVRALRQRLSLAPELVSAPPVRRRSMSMVPSLGWISVVLLVATTVALSVALLLPDRPAILKTESGPLLASASSTQQPSPRLIGVEGRRTFSNEAIALGVSLYGATGSELAMLTGLVSGTRLSVGNPLGDNGWRLPARDLIGALAYAPKDYVGVMNAAIDLRLPNDRLVDSRTMRLEWLPRRLESPSVAVRLPEREDLRTGTRPEPRPEPRPELKPEPKPEPVPQGKPAAVPLTIDGAEVAALLKRGQDYLQNGDIVSARLMLRRAASAGDAQAALLLGASYDPTVLRDLGVLGFAPDPGQARTWYQKAADAGLPEAARRLERLVKTAR